MDEKISIKYLRNRRLFFNAVKGENETVDEWLERIENLAKKCGFARNLHLLLLNKFITGLDDSSFEIICSQRREITLKKSLEILKRHEQDCLINLEKSNTPLNIVKKRSARKNTTLSTDTDNDNNIEIETSFVVRSCVKFCFRIS